MTSFPEYLHRYQEEIILYIVLRRLGSDGINACLWIGDVNGPENHIVVFWTLT
jgi:hypothetical protein